VIVPIRSVQQVDNESSRLRISWSRERNRLITVLMWCQSVIMSFLIFVWKNAISLHRNNIKRNDFVVYHS
jgi:hypothetical protein